MSVNESLRKWVEKITGRRIYKILPLGIDPLYDIRFRFPDKVFNIIFDVGANIGQSATVFAKTFPQSRIYSFEPSAATFQQLKKNLELFNNITFVQQALGAVKQETKMVHADSSDQNRVFTPELRETEGVAMETIQMQTLSGFCAENNIGHIDYLKIDTEGFDLEVLKSGQALLASGNVDFVEVEVGMNKLNTLHIPLEEIKQYMETMNYYLFGIYEQAHEWKKQQYILRRCNPLFVSDKFLAQQKQ